MTRFLSTALGARQPLFGQMVSSLERSSGLPAADIQLSSEIAQVVRSKTIELGMDPDDTTADELYTALQDRLSKDETVFHEALGISDSATSEEVLSIVQKYLSKHEKVSCYALKTATAKRLIKKRAPKAAMKKLGYRSLDSMLRHEAVAHIYAAIQMFESQAWQKTFYDQYAKLKANDFEQREIAVSLPVSKKWSGVCDEYTDENKHNILCFKDLGQVVILPLANGINGLALMTFLLSVHYINDIHTYASYLKLQQVNPDFGKVVQESIGSDQLIAALPNGQSVSWRVVQRYYGRTMAGGAVPSSFQPHIQDAVDTRLNFWQGTQYICAVKDDQPVSFNILDIALAKCNELSFRERVVQFGREHLWSELMTRYVHKDNLEENVERQLAGDVSADLALA